MIFISAQPDDYYFTWQLELQLFNFRRMGIPSRNIHVLIGYNEKRGLRHYFSDLIEKNRQHACFYTYPDKRVNRNYLSSIRPHIIHQHFSAYPELYSEPVFYHDSDVLFSHLPDFAYLQQGPVWYVSDTTSYLSSQYIKSAGGETLFTEMCRTINIPEAVVIANDNNAGGAQYLLKNIPVGFWDTIEKDSEALFGKMERHNHELDEKLYAQSGYKKPARYGIQSWCADMWAILWNGWLVGKQIKVHSQLDFCWPSDPIEKWTACTMLHYSGDMQKNTGLFRKSEYVHYPPFYDRSLKLIQPDTCSFPLVKWIEDYKAALNKTRYDLRDVTFLIPVRIDSESRAENLYMVTACLDKYFDTNIHILESDALQKVDTTLLPQDARYTFTEDARELLHHTRINNILLHNAETDIAVLYDTDVILPIPQIIEAVHILRTQQAEMVSPYDGSFISVDTLFKLLFSKILSPKLLLRNTGKFTIVTERSYGGAVLVNRKKYLAAGMENEHIASWGPEDIERIKRARTLGYNVKRVKGPLFHLPHDRNINSGYWDDSLQIAYMNEYFKICNLSPTALTEYIQTWPWAKTPAP